MLDAPDIVFDDADIAPELRDFLSWYAAKGGQAPGVSLARFPGMGTGVAAVAAKAENDLVFSVPLDIVITRESVKARGKAFRDLSTSVQDDEDLVSAVLMLERARGDASDWAPYVAALPRYVPQTSSFDENEIAMLEDDDVATNARQRRAEIEGRFKAVKPKLDKLAAAEGVQGAAAEAQLGLADFTWALSLVNSRALTLHGRKFLVPFADMFNYAPQRVSRSAQSGANFLKYHKVEDGAFRVFADRAAEAGEQLFEDYGDNDNRLYLEHHGFVALDNPFDCVHLDLPALTGSDEVVARKQKLLGELAATDRQLFTCVPPTGKASRRLNARLVIAGMSEHELGRCDAVVEGQRDPESLSACLGDGLGGADGEGDNSKRAMYEAAAAQLSGFSTSLKKDEALLSRVDTGEEAMSENAALALRYRVSRKRILKGIKRSLSKFAPKDKASKAAKKKDKGAAAGKPPAEDLVALCDRFNAWFMEHSPLSLIKAAPIPGMRIGTVAVRDIAPEELYISVPTDIIMSAETALKSPGLKDTLADLRKRFVRGDRFHELLFHLIYETFVEKENSKFWPYIETLPNPAEMGFPMFYSDELMAELEGSLVLNDLREYRSSALRKFRAVKEAVLDHYDVFDPAVFNWENYQWAHAVLDSRSIWWNSDRNLVPMLDLINCVEGPDPSRVHSTDLDKTGKLADTYAPWGFKAGEQVFENYGQPNNIYFSYHGFSLEENTHDCVKVEVSFDEAEGDDVAARRTRLQQMGFNGPRYEECITPHADHPPRFQAFVEVAHGVSGHAAVDDVVADIARKRLAAYPTSLEEDVSIVRTPGLTWPDSAPVTFRMTEKRLLRGLAGLPALDEDAIAGGASSEL